LSTPGPSRRQARSAKTRQALRQAALDLFATRGYDSVTTDMIAERAGVSPRTFFRYFPTKESVLLGGKVDWNRSFVDKFPAQPATSNDVEAVCATFVALAPLLIGRRRRLLAYERAVASSSTLRGHVQDHQAEDRGSIASAVAVRRGLTEPDESCHLLALVAFCAFRAALDSWLAGPAEEDLGAAIAQYFEILCDTMVADGSTRFAS